ncbi:MoaA/NifB/PqqE/SkfB family radical SAM enzyme [Anaerobacterium chartisolvens]|uniref:MoaA/NifB/PqqE/SkfB family radical SAM enzyme n=1 Tax=Anaerobacterium chartisolvens TaxID=1297424 RepID=A0A369AP44_9FIRM|nr:radical SAM protein [Anaerobacterium chartisolvens]RCX11130.1 MoaA/NifB/PqqE/SkfB family radical SAM enzyme [Anaerobacterium chartisolvens]
MNKLREVTLYTNFNCNLRCKMCYMNGVSRQNNRYSFEKKNYKMSFDFFKNAIDQFLKLNPKCSFWFMGGEPLLHEDIISMVAYIKKHGESFIDINTNGTFLKDKGQSLIDKGVDSLTVSLDGFDSETCDEVRGKGVYDMVVPEVRRLVEYKKRNNINMIININYTLVSSNYLSASKMLDLCGSLGVDNFYIDLPAFISYEDGAQTQKIYSEMFNIQMESWKGQLMSEVYEAIDKDRLIEQFEKIYSADKAFGFDMVPHGCSPAEIGTYFGREWENKINGSLCTKINYRTTLLPDGGIAPCTLYHDLVFGNLYESSFEDIWNGEKYQLFRKALSSSLFPGCKRCCDLLDEHDELSFGS